MMQTERSSILEYAKDVAKTVIELMKTYQIGIGKVTLCHWKMPKGPLAGTQYQMRINHIQSTSGHLTRKAITRLLLKHSLWMWSVQSDLRRYNKNFRRGQAQVLCQNTMNIQRHKQKMQVNCIEIIDLLNTGTDVTNFSKTLISKLASSEGKYSASRY